MNPDCRNYRTTPNVAFGVTVEDRKHGIPRLDLARHFPARYRWVSVEPQLEDLGDVDFRGFDLVVNGGEAGPDSRPFDLQWARNVRDAARASGALYFMKQAGDNVVSKHPGDHFGHGSDMSTWGIWKDVGLMRLDIGKKGNDLAKLPCDLRIRENLPMP